jgi:hypothetical protein
LYWQANSQSHRRKIQPAAEFYFAVPRTSNHIGRPKQKLKTKKKSHLLNFLLFGLVIENLLSADFFLLFTVLFCRHLDSDARDFRTTLPTPPQATPLAQLDAFVQ